MICEYFLGSVVSLLLGSKYVRSHIHSGVFFGFCIVFVSKPVNVTWDDESAFNQKFGTLSIPHYFNFWDLVNAAFSSSTVIFSYSCTFTFSFSFSIFLIQLADILQAFFSRHIPFQNFSILSLGGVSFTLTWFFSVSI